MRLNSLRVKGAGTFLVMGCAAVLIGVVGNYGVGRVDAALQSATKGALPRLALVTGMDRALAGILFQTRAALVALYAKDQERVSDYRAKRDQALGALGESGAAFLSMGAAQTGDRSASELVELLLGAKVASDAIWAAVDGRDAEAARKAALRGEKVVGRTQAVLGGLVKAEEEAAEKLGAAGDAAVGSARTLLFIGAAGAFVLALIFGAILAIVITGPVEKIRDAALRLAKGDIEQRVEHKGRDELGDLADAFRDLIDYIRTATRAAESIGRGDLSAAVVPRSEHDVLSRGVQQSVDSLRSLVDEIRKLTTAAEGGELGRRADAGRFQGGYAELVQGVNRMLDGVLTPVREAVDALEKVAARDLTARMRGTYRGEHARIKEALNQAVDNLDQGLGQVSLSTHQVRSASSQIAASSQSLSSGASEQASAVTETSASLGEMAQMTQKNAESARTANGLVRDARGASDKGNAAMRDMVEAMAKIRASAEATAEIIRDINEIAFQTNLLALNAAVEAARAGDAGRGFAVVAEEVRGLAMRAKEAAKKTESLINDSVQFAATGEKISRDVGSHLGEIVGAVASVNEIVGSIAESSDQQSEGISQVSTAVSQMDQVTQTNAAASEQLSSTAEELSAQAEELAALVGRFSLSSGSGGSSSTARPVSSARGLPHGSAANQLVSSRSRSVAKAPPPKLAVKAAAPDPLPMGDDEAFNDF